MADFILLLWIINTTCISVSVCSDDALLLVKTALVYAVQQPHNIDNRSTRRLGRCNIYRIDHSSLNSYVDAVSREARKQQLSSISVQSTGSSNYNYKDMTHTYLEISPTIWKFRVVYDELFDIYYRTAIIHIR